MKYQIPVMLKQGGGAILDNSSGAGIKGFKGARRKHGVVGLTKAAALDYAASNIRINAGWPSVFSAIPVAKDVFEKRPG